LGEVSHHDQYQLPLEKTITQKDKTAGNFLPVIANLKSARDNAKTPNPVVKGTDIWTDGLEDEE
jgi:hypothetical protein